MRRALVLALVASFGLSAPVSAQSSNYVQAPWWMREPVIASIGYVRVEVPANRAFLFASFQAVESNPAKATEKAAAQIRELGAALQRIGGDKIRVQTTFTTVPLYEQYRDKDGNIQENRRADKIDRYQVNANVQIEIRDTSLAQRVYATVIAARPASTNQISFRLEPTNELKTWLYNEAVKDAARRARTAAEASGGRLGAVKAIDPTGRLCETDVLALRMSDGYAALQPTDVEYDSVSPPMVAPAPPPPPPPPAPFAANGAVSLESAGDALQLTIQPPMQTLEARSCVIYALG